MKHSIIDEIFYAIREKSEIFEMPNEHYKKKGQKICEMLDVLQNTLNKEQVDMLDKFLDAVGKDHCDEVDFFFSMGFKIGTLLGIECGELSDKLPKLD